MTPPTGRKRGWLLTEAAEPAQAWKWARVAAGLALLSELAGQCGKPALPWVAAVPAAGAGEAWVRAGQFALPWWAAVLVAGAAAAAEWVKADQPAGVERQSGHECSSLCLKGVPGLLDLPAIILLGVNDVSAKSVSARPDLMLESRCQLPAALCVIRTGVAKEQ